MHEGSCAKDNYYRSSRAMKNAINKVFPNA
jgi:hypothetical protein